MPKPVPAVCEELPPLPSASVELDVLEAALSAGKSGDEAVALATISPAAEAEKSHPAESEEADIDDDPPAPAPDHETTL